MGIYSSANWRELLSHAPWRLDEERGGDYAAAVCGLVMVLIPVLYLRWRSHPRYGRNPGGRVYPVVGNFPLYLWNWSRIYDFTVDLMRNQEILKTRSVLPGGQVSYITADPVNVEHILKTNFENYPKGELFRATLHDVLGDGILNTDGELWRMQRKVASFEFSMRSLRTLMFETVQEELESRLMPLLSRASNQSEAQTTLDLQDLLKRFSFDNICRLSVGVDPGCLDASLPNLEFEQAFDDATGVASARFMNIIWKLLRAWNVGSERRLSEAVTKIRRFLMGVIKERRQEIITTGDGSSRVDLLSRFMDYGERAGEEKLSDTFLCDMLVSFVQAGRDTVATALVWFFWMLIVNPEVESAILAELGGIVAARQQPTKGFSFEELKSMHYLQAALFESMRMNAPVPSDLKMADRDDVWPDGTRVARNSFVGYHPYAMGKLESVWGPDCHEFKPERWLKDGVFVSASPSKFPVFQAGPRICLGKEVGIVQMKLIAAAVLNQFSLSVPEGFRPEYRLSFVLAMAGGLPVYVRRR